MPEIPQPYFLVKFSDCDYIFFALLSVLVYDHAITFHLEVERIWTLQWRLPKLLFFINRYLAPGLIVTLNAIASFYKITPSICQIFTHIHIWSLVVTLLTAEIVLVLRVSALYGHTKNMRHFLTGLCVCQVISVIVLASIVDRDMNRLYMGFWIAFVIFDGIIIILTMYKAFSYRKDMNPTIRLLARDSIVYFVIMFGTFLFNAIPSPGKTIQGIILVLPVECIVCTAVARMMMNIRGLIFDTQYGSQVIGASALKFHTPTGASRRSENDGEDIYCT